MKQKIIIPIILIIITLITSSLAWSGIQEDHLYYLSKARSTYREGDYLRSIALLKNFFNEVELAAGKKSDLDEEYEALVMDKAKILLARD